MGKQPYVRLLPVSLHSPRAACACGSWSASAVANYENRACACRLQIRVRAPSQDPRISRTDYQFQSRMSLLLTHTNWHGQSSRKGILGRTAGLCVSSAAIPNSKCIFLCPYRLCLPLRQATLSGTRSHSVRLPSSFTGCEQVYYSSCHDTKPC
ncbi:hypothetical protein BJ166DRAFT_288359 [Pestalotiopsis sp. NC0098]|nr:hypothetical protein BJ166DRAFT_288359 [Pestalotiopsis sp. NC0098]